MTRNNEFDKYGFLDYMEQAYDINQQTRNIIANIIAYAEEHANTGRDQLCDFIHDLLGELEYSEVYAFADDNILTEQGQTLKRVFLNSVWYKEVTA